MEQQFSQAQTIASKRETGDVRNHNSDDEVVCLTNTLNAPLSPNYISTYVSDDSKGQLQDQDIPLEPAAVNPTDIPAPLETAPASEVQLTPARFQMQDFSSAPEVLMVSNDCVGSEPTEGAFKVSVSTEREDSIWWSQDPDSLGEVFSHGFCFLNELGFEMDTY